MPRYSLPFLIEGWGPDEIFVRWMRWILEQKNRLFSFVRMPLTKGRKAASCYGLLIVYFNFKYYEN